MGIITSIIRSKDDLGNFEEKVYKDCKISFDVVEIEELLKNRDLFSTIERLKKNELAGIERISSVIVLSSTSNERIITVFELKQMLDDMGFNVDPLFSEERGDDFSC